MASATRTPPAPPMPPGPPMRPRAPRSLAGPIVLIAIGILFLLGTMHLVNVHALLRWFAHYWPVLLILWGVIKLVEYRQANRVGVRPPGIGAGGILLIVFLVASGLIATEAYNVNWPEIRDQMHIEDADVPWWGHTYDFNAGFERPFRAGDSLRITSARGAVNLTVSNDNQMHVTVHKRVNAENQNDADKWDKSTGPKVSGNGQVITLDSNTQGAGEHWVAADLDVALPRKASVMVQARRGDVSIMGRDGNAEVTSQNSDVAVTDLNGSLSLNLDHSSARISQVSADVTIQGRSRDVSIEDVKGMVHLDGDFMESVKLSRIRKPVSFKTTRTDIGFSGIEGYLNLDHANLEASNVLGPFHLRTRSKDIMLNGVSGDVRVENENGAVEIHLNKLGGLEVQNAKGDMRIFVPQNAAFELDAQAKDGEIQSDFSQPKINNGDDRAIAVGSVNGGGPRMVLRNEHGTIEIRRGVFVAPAPNSRPPRSPEPPEVPEPTEN
ncbi:MAG: DUF4097 family beta strand repeat protein [Acidobacteria bacterium]|nr:DUF4097 family beta strand repeat protein [Acidobacteriota bacterium]